MRAAVPLPRLCRPRKRAREVSASELASHIQSVTQTRSKQVRGDWLGGCCVGSTASLCVCSLSRVALHLTRCVPLILFCCCCCGCSVVCFLFVCLPHVMSFVPAHPQHPSQRLQSPRHGP